MKPNYGRMNNFIERIHKSANSKLKYTFHPHPPPLLDFMRLSHVKSVTVIATWHVLGLGVENVCSRYGE